MAATPLVPGRAAGFGLGLGRLALGAPSPALGALCLLQLGSAPLGLFARAPSPSLGTAGFLFLLAPRLLFLLQPPAPLAAGLVLGAAGLLGRNFCRDPFGFLLGPTRTAGGAAGFPFGIRLPDSPPRLVVRCDVPGTAAGIRP